MKIRSFSGTLTISITLLSHVFPSVRGNDKCFMFYPKLQRAIRFVSDFAETWETRLETMVDEMEAVIHSFPSGTPFRRNDPFAPLLKRVPIRGEYCRLAPAPFTLESLEPITWEAL